MGEEAEKKKRAKAEETEELNFPTAAELESIREEAYQEGFEQGKAEGKAEGLKQGLEEGRKTGLEQGKQEGLKVGQEQGEIKALAEKQSQIDKHIVQLRKVASSLQFPLEEIQDSVEEALVNLSLAISRAVIYRELKIDRDHMVHVVRDVLAALPSKDEQAFVSIHPEDAEFLKSYLPEDDSFRYLVDASLMPGGCRVETRHTLLDFTVEKRFQTVVQQMLSRHTQPAEPQEGHDFTEQQMGEMSDLHRDLLSSGADDEDAE